MRLALALILAATSAEAECQVNPARAAEMVARVNAERAAAGLPALKRHPLLDEAAIKHACDMEAKGYFAHEGRDGSTPMTRVKRTGYAPCGAAENISQGYPSAESAMAGLMQSAGHRANILRRQVNEIGVGVAHGQNGPFYVQVFGKRCR